MDQVETSSTDFGTGQKKLGVYVIGVMSCALLTLVSFWAVMSHQFVKWEVFTIIYTAACIQFIVQLLCFIRLNIQTDQGKINVMSILFTMVILISIVIGSLWIMSNLDYNIMH